MAKKSPGEAEKPHVYYTVSGGTCDGSSVFYSLRNARNYARRCGGKVERIYTAVRPN